MFLSTPLSTFLFDSLHSITIFSTFWSSIAVAVVVKGQGWCVCSWRQPERLHKYATPDKIDQQREANNDHDDHNPTVLRSKVVHTGQTVIGEHGQRPLAVVDHPLRLPLNCGDAIFVLCGPTLGHHTIDPIMVHTTSSYLPRHIHIGQIVLGVRLQFTSVRDGHIISVLLRRKLTIIFWRKKLSYSSSGKNVNESLVPSVVLAEIVLDAGKDEPLSSSACNTIEHDPVGQE